MSTDTPLGLEPPGVVILCGPFGSGKTEIAINLAIRWAALGRTYLADLDVMTPYFRSREHAAPLEAAGVKLVAPTGPAAVYDTPVLPPEMSGVALDSDSGMVVDVGGQECGAAVLAHFQEALQARGAKMLFVVNPRRPEADDPGAMALLAETISSASGLAFAGVVANGNLGRATLSDDVVGDLPRCRDVGEALGVPVIGVCCAERLVPEVVERADGLPVMGLRFYLRPAWEQA